MPKPITNQIERNIAKVKSVKDIINLFKSEKKNDNGIDDTKYKGLRNIRYLYGPKMKKGNGIDDTKHKGLRELRYLFKPKKEDNDIKE